MNTTQEMIAVLQSYIFHRKGVNVDINQQQFIDPINVMKLHKAYSIAVNWFNNNNGSINLL